MILIKSYLLLSAFLYVWSDPVPAPVLLVMKEDESEIVSQAFKKPLLEIFVPINKTINVITKIAVRNNVQGLVKRVTQNHGHLMTFNIESMTQFLIDHDSKVPKVFILDYFFPQMMPILVQQAMFNMFYLHGISSEQYLKYFKELYLQFPKRLSNFLLLIDEGDYLSLKMPAFFSKTSCDDVYLKIINRFSKALQEWELPSFDLDVKFHGCQLKVSFYGLPPEIITPTEQSQRGTFDEYSGYFVDITRELAKQLDFKIDAHEFVGEFYHLNVNGYYEKNDFNYMTTVNRNVYFLIPLGDFYTGLEKLFLPYDDIGWILIVMTFSVGLVVIQVVHRLSKNTQNLVFGHGVTMPSFNLFLAFFGFGQITLPGRNFARFLLIVYILWCLIIRTAYQSILYELLSSDGRKPQNRDIEDFLSEGENTIFCINYFCFNLVYQLVANDYGRFYGSSRNYNEKDVHDHVELIRNSSGNIVMVIDDLLFAMSNEKKAFHGVKLIKNENFHIPLRFATASNHFLQEKSKLKLLHMQEAGLIEKMKLKYYNPKYLELIEEENELKVLSVVDLSIGFQLFLLFIGVSILYFVFEILRFKWHKYRGASNAVIVLN